MSTSSYPPPPAPTISLPEEAWFSLGIFLLVVAVFQWGLVLYSKMAKQRRPRMDTDEESTHASSAHTLASGKCSLGRLPVAAVNVFRVVAFRWTIEFGTYDLRVVDIVLTLGYLAFLFGWTFQDAAEIGVTSLNLRKWSGRAGLLAASQFPLVTALGTKNNVISILTGISYEKLNYLHRVTARSCFALLLFHAGSKIYGFVRLGIFEEILKTPFVRLGLMAITSLAILFTVSLRRIRTRAYEVFFYVHLVAVFIFLLGGYFHTKQVNASHWIWPAFMFWALDRFMRLARMVVSNHLYCGFGRRAKLQDATTELLSDDFVRVRVRRPAHFQWSPGQTAYLTMPSVSAFPLEAHPFSIASVDSALFHPNTKDKYPARVGDGREVAEDANWKELVFLINVRGGFTQRLKATAVQNRIVKLFIDGPYGRVPDTTVYDTSIFVAGGSGITYTLPVFLNMIEAARNGPCRCRRVVFIWAVRDASHIEWISDALYQANALKPTWLSVSIRVFVTKGGKLFKEDLTDPEQSPAKEGSLENWIAPPSVRVENGRPDMKVILRGEVSTATGSLSVSVCGSQSLTRSVRRALRFPVSGFSNILRGGPSVTLHVESFGYA